jgi:hypothetical protein
MTIIVSSMSGEPFRFAGTSLRLRHIPPLLSTLSLSASPLDKLVGHEEITPKSVCDQQLVTAYAKEFLYLEGIA